MKTLLEIKEQIEEIRNSDFQIDEFVSYDGNYKVSKLLRIVLLCVNAIGTSKDFSKDEKKELQQELDEVMKRKLKELNPNFSEETLNNMINAYQRGYIIYPMDIFVVDDAVFHKEGIFDDYGRIYKVKTLMFRGMKPYYDVTDIYFMIDEDDFVYPAKKQLTNEDERYTSKFISDSINAIYNANITRPIYELNTDRTFYGYGGINQGKIRGINVYLNMRFNDIGERLKSKQECDMKLCIQDGDNITLYDVHQSFRGDEPVWSVVKTNNEVWRLTEAVLRLESKSTNFGKKKKLPDSDGPSYA